MRVATQLQSEKIMKKILFALVLIGSLFGCKSVNGPDPVAMDTYENVPIVTTTKGTLSNEQVRKTIVRSAEASNWVVQEGSASGPVVVKYTYKDKHIATVKITYTQHAFTIAYENSVNMKYRIADGSDSYLPSGSMNGARSFYPVGTKLIHATYNQWIKALKDKIQAGFRAE